MILGRVLGTVVATAHHRAYDGHKVLVVQPVDPSGRPAGSELLAVDHSQAGAGDLVLVNREGNGARQMLGTLDGKLPIRAVVVGVVDAVDGPAGAASQPALAKR